MTTSKIVVAVDESAGARKAFQWAVQQAKLHGATLEVVRVYQVMSGSLPQASIDATGHTEELLAGVEGEARQAAETFLKGLVADAPADVKIDPVVVRGRPATELLERAQGADMIVVGSRGRGGFTGLLLGSVSQQVVQHAPCPVVVIPATAV